MSSQVGVPIRYSDASGNTLPMPSSYSVPGFPGQSRTLADLYYNMHRDYDSSTGRYIQADPIGLDGGPSPYSYAMNNPLRYMDPSGLITYWEHYTGLPDAYRTNAMNAIAGISDSATFGATYQVREWLGANDEIDSECSSYYRGGEYVAMGLGGLRLAYAGAAKVGSILAKSGAEASAFRNAIKGAARGTFGKAKYKIYSNEFLLQKYGSDAAVRAAAGRTNNTYNAYGGGVVANVAAHCGCK
jgi:RHS repeat-associated protein